jgi:signal transduction histidine kinase
MEFIADADSLDPFANSGSDGSRFVDVNRDGRIEPDGPDKLQWPGQPYPEAAEIPETFAAYYNPITSADLYTDEYGTVLTGYAPIKDSYGNVVAVLATDIKADDFFAITTQTLKPFQVFITFLTLIITILTVVIIYTSRRYTRSLESSEEQLQLTNETLYKHSHEQAIKNKVLSILRQIYEISTLTLTQKQLAEQVAYALQSEFDFEIVGIFEYNQDNKSLSSLSVVTSEQIRNVASTQFDALDLQNVATNTFLSSIISEKSMRYSEDFSEAWKISPLEDAGSKLKPEQYIRSTIGYPLIVDNKVIGVVIISLNRLYNDLIDYERDSMRNFMNVISITLNRVTLYEELGLANKRQENLIHFITHEVKGYLTKSQAVFAAITEGDFENVSAPLMALSLRALAETKKGVETVRDILEASNLKKGTTQYANTPFNLKELVTTAIDSFKATIEEKGLGLETNLVDGMYPCVGDPDKISRHLIRNLIDNAIRYTPNGTISISLTKTDTTAVFSIKDTGVGIDVEDIGHLFVEGGRGKDSIKVNVDSTGYGLFIAKMIAEAHQGKVWVESAGKGTGSTFFVTLPLIQ